MNGGKHTEKSRRESTRLRAKDCLDLAWHDEIAGEMKWKLQDKSPNEDQSKIRRGSYLSSSRE